MEKMFLKFPILLVLEVQIWVFIGPLEGLGRGTLKPSPWTFSATQLSTATKWGLWHPVSFGDIVSLVGLPQSYWRPLSPPLFFCSNYCGVRTAQNLGFLVSCHNLSGLSGSDAINRYPKCECARQGRYIKLSQWKYRQRSFVLTRNPGLHRSSWCLQCWPLGLTT